MTKKDIVRQIADEVDVPQIKCKRIVLETFKAIIATLISEGRIELRNFGVFEVRRRKGRKAHNPRTGEAVSVEPKNVVTFQAGKVMAELVRTTAKVHEKKISTRRKKKVAAAAAAESETSMPEGEVPEPPPADPTAKKRKPGPKKKKLKKIEESE